MFPPHLRPDPPPPALRAAAPFVHQFHHRHDVQRLRPYPRRRRRHSLMGAIMIIVIVAAMTTRPPPRRRRTSRRCYAIVALLAPLATTSYHRVTPTPFRPLFSPFAL